jgi:predicted transcriptional regulator
MEKEMKVFGCESCGSRCEKMEQDLAAVFSLCAFGLIDYSSVRDNACCRPKGRRMTVVTVELPDGVKKAIEELAAKEGFSMNQFLASAAGEKLAVMQTMDYLRREAAAGRRQDFEKYLAASPDLPPMPGDEL